MQIKWLITLLVATSLFVVSSFFIPAHLVFGYRWMTIGVGIVAFIYYFTVTLSNKKDNNAIIGGNMAAIALKFILSSVVMILYIIFIGVHNRMDFAFFLLAYGVFSIISYFFSYTFRKD